uniref:Uncharacterized protein n=1 Tax=uncultured marine thaumarchaeote KM3_03_B05 TaxID=1455958 RepID=A0A075G768_9ARCH|nr:hypothetical protein [uncultured marine thaumarchaeote KM3_03_B05]
MIDTLDYFVFTHEKETYSMFFSFLLRESPSLVNGVRFRSLSPRSSWVQIPLPAFYYNSETFLCRRSLTIFPEAFPLTSFMAIPIRVTTACSPRSFTRSRLF